jgi:hypothetical protein|tara:strand:+ start:3891 stop:4307 length:417 start_codon:yes stop_codon:yes gene_type:complete
MRLLNIYGRLQKRSVSKYLINWNKKSRSKIQFKVKKFLEPFWKANVVYEEFPVYGTRMSVDILNATKKIAIEVQGRQHSEFNKFFHGNSRLKYLEGIKRDIKKAEWLEKNGFILLEVEENEVDLLSVKFFLDKFGTTL